MPIISAETIKNQIYRVTLMVSQGLTKNVVVSDDGLYCVHYIKNKKLISQTGKILNVVQDPCCCGKPDNRSYILFDNSDDMSAKRERIAFYQIQNIIDITPNDAYAIAVKHGFNGTVEDWLKSLKGDPGASAYELAIDAGFEGTQEEWLQSLHGKSAYELAVENGYTGTLQEWLDGHQAEVVSEKVQAIENKLSWIVGMGSASADPSDNKY